MKLSERLIKHQLLGVDVTEELLIIDKFPRSRSMVETMNLIFAAAESIGETVAVKWVYQSSVIGECSIELVHGAKSTNVKTRKRTLGKDDSGTAKSRSCRGCSYPITREKT